MQQAPAHRLAPHLLRESKVSNEPSELKQGAFGSENIQVYTLGFEPHAKRFKVLWPKASGNKSRCFHEVSPVAEPLKRKTDFSDRAQKLREIVTLFVPSSPGQSATRWPTNLELESTKPSPKAALGDRLFSASLVSKVVLLALIHLAL